MVEGEVEETHGRTRSTLSVRQGRRGGTHQDPGTGIAHVAVLTHAPQCCGGVATGVTSTARSDVAPSVPALAVGHAAVRAHASVVEADPDDDVAPRVEPAELVDVCVRGDADRAERGVERGAVVSEPGRGRAHGRRKGQTRHPDDCERESRCD